MNRRWILTGLTAAAMAVVSPEASAQQAHGFGNKGELIVSADRLVPVFSHTTQSVRPFGGPRTSTIRSSSSLLFGGDVSNRGAGDGGAGVFGMNPHTIPRVAIDYAVIDRLTLGGAAALGFTMGGDSPSTTAFGLAPRVGYILPVSSVIGFWFRGGFSFYSLRTRVDQGPAVNYDIHSTSLFSLDLDPQLAIVPYEHFFFTVGPLVNIPLTGSRTTEQVRGLQPSQVFPEQDVSIFHFGIHAGIGGWFNL
jgi:hypothetical protein